MIRLIARLDIKGKNLIKGVHLEGLRVVGNPSEFALKYYEQGIDEILYIDSVASLYGRNSLHDLVERTVQDTFIPVTVGGGIRSVEDVRAMLRSGADKVAINTAALNRPELIREVATTFGSQCMVLSVQAKRQPNGTWEAFSDNGRERSGREVLSWVQEAQELGAGEILLTSIDQEGTGKGFDVDLVACVSSRCMVPLIASGGMDKVEDMLHVVRQGNADAVAAARALHYGRLSIREIKDEGRRQGLPMRSAAPGI